MKVMEEERDSSAVSHESTREFLLRQQDKGILKHFVPAEDPPVTFPMRRDIHPARWLVCRDLPDCFLPILEDGMVVTSQFFCRGCNEWREVSGTFHHIVDHFKIGKHSEETFEKSHQMSIQKNRMIRNSLIWLIASHGLSFSIADSLELQSICTGLPHRHSLRAIILKISERMKDDIKQILSRAHRLEISFDEWSDRVQRRFLGLNCVSWMGHELGRFFLKCENLDMVMKESDHLTAEMIKTVVLNALDEYGITDKVSVFVSDRGSDMLLAGKLIARQLSREVIHGNCICHLVNNLMEEFVKDFAPIFDKVFQLRNDLSSLTFSHYLRRQKRSTTAFLPM